MHGEHLVRFPHAIVETIGLNTRPTRAPGLVEHPAPTRAEIEQLAARAQRGELPTHVGALWVRPHVRRFMVAPVASVNIVA